MDRFVIRSIPFLFLLTALPLWSSAFGAEKQDLVLEEILIIGSKADAALIAGSADVVSEVDLERFDHVDLRKLLGQVPGVYVREEDGFGLRPNIGIRGAAAERSQKVTILRDEVLITPAPYSAPAAYYVPNVSRVSSLEVMKGPAAVKYGPHTVGGAINMASSSMPIDPTGSVDVSGGSDGYYKGQISYGATSEKVGYFVDLLTYGADGFKSIDGSEQPTGFERNDFGFKLLYRVPDSRRQHKLTLLIEGGDEDADETYLGLSDSDFAEEPYRRYAASQMAKFKSEHYNLLLNYSALVAETTASNLKVYWNQFDRSWNKLDGFLSGPTLQRVLGAPDQYQNQYSVLTGQKNSSGSDYETLDVTNNDRKYVSGGLQWSLKDDRTFGSLSVSTSFGIRFHMDQVKRNHQPTTYLMSNLLMTPDAIPRPPKTLNKVESDAFAAYLVSRFFFDDLSVDLGVRHEKIDGQVVNNITDITETGTQKLTAPSVGAIWRASETISLFAGVYEGFSPAGPASDADHEESTNYEFGVKYFDDKTRAEITGFHSDYENLIGRCRVSDVICSPGSEFNGGQVEISGAEISASHAMPLGDRVSLEVAVAYTYSESEFRSTFYSRFPQWGLVREGDELPYIPQSIGNARLSFFGQRWLVEGSLNFQSVMREVPGISSIEEDLHSDDFAILDLSASYRFSDAFTLQVTMLNVADRAVIVSHRPFGARPNRPRSLIGRVKYRF